MTTNLSSPAVALQRIQDVYPDIDKIGEILQQHKKDSEEVYEAMQEMRSQVETKAVKETTGKILERYGVTDAEALVYIQTAEAINLNTADSGIVAVPWWTAEEMEANRKLLESQNDQIQSLITTVEHLKEALSTQQVPEDLVVKDKTNILTGRTEPYIAGVTGPRVGDEHLDDEYLYHK